jgi:hypothetical protein
MTSAADLLALQEIDLRRDGRRALIADIDSRLGETEDLIVAREAVKAADAELTQLNRAQRDLEARLEDLEARIRPLEKKLYDGSIRNPKELTDLQREVEHLKARRGQLDDEGLSLLDRLEEAAAALARARGGLERTEAAWREEQGGLSADRAQAQQESDRLQVERDQRTREMDGKALGLYETLRGHRQGRAVAVVERGACQGCRLTLPTHLVQRVRQGDALVQCPSCERILVAG